MKTIFQFKMEHNHHDMGQNGDHHMGHDMEMMPMTTDPSAGHGGMVHMMMSMSVSAVFEFLVILVLKSLTFHKQISI